MKTSNSINAFAILLVLSCAATAQNSGKATPVTFKKGATSVSLKGQIKGSEYRDYTVKAGAGQTLTMTLKESNSQAYANIMPADSEEALFIGSTSGNKAKIMLPDDGTYKVRVYLMRAAARRGTSSSYTLTIGLTGKVIPTVPASTDAVLPGTRFHAQAKVPCSLDLFKQVTECDAFVVRRVPNGSATVEFRSQGTKRRILFLNSKPVASDSTEKLTFSRRDDVTVVKVGKRESYSVPDALISGG